MTAASTVFTDVTAASLTAPTVTASTTATISGYTIFPQPSPKAAVVAKTADYTVTSAEYGKIMTNTGSSGTVVFTLPAAAASIGKVLGIAVTAAQIVRALPATGEKVYLNGSGVASKYLNIAAVVGNFANLYSDGTDWIVTNYNGVVTKES